MKLSAEDIKSVQGDLGHAQVDMVTEVCGHILDEDKMWSSYRMLLIKKNFMIIKEYIMEADPKKIYMQDKNDLIIFLNLIIELTIKHYNRYKAYYAELLDLAAEQISEMTTIKKESINEDNFDEVISEIMKSEKKIKNYKITKYRYLDYKAMEDKIGNVQDQILNLIGDRTSKGGVSYWRFRNEYKKMKEKNNLPILAEFPEKFNKTMNEIYTARNYSHHITDAKFIEWKNYREKQLIEAGHKLFEVWPSEEIVIDRYEYVGIEWIWQLVLSQIEFKKIVKEVLMQMKKDYSILYGKSIKIRSKWEDRVGCSHFEVSIKGFKRHQGKMK